MKRLILLLTIATYVSCSSEHTKEHVNEQGSQDTTTQPGHAHESETSTQVQLNNGAKWQANDATTQGINRMKVLAEEFPSDASAELYSNLYEKLDAEFNVIFEKCTMTGESHDQLHNYLLPLKDSINKLKSNDLNECGKALADIKMHLDEYGNYFQ